MSQAQLIPLRPPLATPFMPPGASKVCGRIHFFRAILTTLAASCRLV